MADKKDFAEPIKPPPKDPDPATDAFMRMVVGRAHGDGVQLPTDPEAERKYPKLWKWLTTRHPDKTFVVEPARISIGLGMGVWIMTVSHADYRTKLEVASPTLDGCFGAWEALIGSPNPPLKTWGKGEVTLRKRRKEDSA